MAIQTYRSGFNDFIPTIERYGWEHTKSENFYDKWGYREAEVLHVRGVSGGDIEFHEIFSTGSLRQANFAASGAYVKAPKHSRLWHSGTRNAAATAVGLVAIRQDTANATIADWFSADGVALSTLVTD